MRITNRHASEIQIALSRILPLDLPYKTSLPIALLAFCIEEQLYLFSKVRDKYVNDFDIRVKSTDSGDVEFLPKVEPETESEFIDKEKTIEEFKGKIQELMLTIGRDIDVTISFLPDFIIKPETLKPLIPFIKVENVN